MRIIQGLVFDIQRFSVHDGPGIRTTVFFKGCNLRCFWCHNPESVDLLPEIMFVPQKCIGCGKCLTACKNGCHAAADGKHVFLRENCVRCGECAKTCFAKALTIAGTCKTAEEVLDEVEKDMPFYKNSGGGMTCSGGEPMLQTEFLRELLMKAKDRGISTAVDTAGNVPFENFLEVLPYTDLFLYDLKSMDDSVHREATGVVNERIKENIRKLSEAGARIWVRIPVIPGVNAEAGNMEATAELLKPLNPELVELLTFHKLGGGKYESVGRVYAAKNLEPKTKAEMAELAEPFRAAGIKVKVS